MPRLYRPYPGERTTVGADPLHQRFRSHVLMPRAVARKLEFEIAKRGLDLDLQVRAIALTHDQCVEWKLPRTPTKETDTAAAGFEARYGKGQTELDALEALYPGRLAEIITAELRR